MNIEKYYELYNIKHLSRGDLWENLDKRPDNINRFIEDLINKLEYEEKRNKENRELRDHHNKTYHEDQNIKRRLRDKIASLRRQTDNIGVQFEDWVDDWHNTILDRIRKI